MTVFMFGAGASQGTLGHRAPVAREFGGALEEEVPEWGARFPSLARVAAHLNQPMADMDLVQLWTCIDYYAKLQDVFPGRKPWEGESKDLKRALLCVYGSRCDAAAEQLDLDGDATLVAIARQVAAGDVIVSFNYDTVIERLLIRCGHHVKAVGCVGNPDTVLLAKPHGSASWAMDFNTRKVHAASADWQPLVVSISDIDVLERRREPLVLGAVPIKSELIHAVQMRHNFIDVFEVVIRQWKAIVTALSTTPRLVVVGYSFPREDAYGRFLFAEAMRMRTAAHRTALQIEYYELESRVDVTRASVMETFSIADSSVRWKGAVHA